MFLAACGNTSDKEHSEEKRTADSLVVENHQNATVTIEQLLDDYEIMIGEIREKFYIDGKYKAPPGHQYHTQIHPVVELYEDLKSLQHEMTHEELARFRSLTKKIRETF